MTKIILTTPVTVDGQEYAALEMRGPRVRDMLAADKAGANDAAREVALFANLCEVAPGVIGELTMKDYALLQGVYSGFLS